MSLIRIATNFNIDIEFISPPFYKRFVAWLIDLVILVVYLIVVGRIITSLQHGYDGSRDDAYDLAFIRIILILPFFAYHLVSEITLRGQSLGKKMVGIRVISMTGTRASISQHIIRCLIRVSDYTLLFLIMLIPNMQAYGDVIYWGIGGVFVLLIADIFLANTGNQQRLGDLLAHTIIIENKQRAEINDTIFLELNDQYVPSYPQVMDLSDRDINSLKGILETARKKHDYQLAEMASEKIKNHLHIETSQSPFDFLEILLKDYNYLSSH